MYRQILLFMVILVFMGTVNAQQISVKSFRKLETDLAARGREAKTDQNGDRCAIIKVVTNETGFVFEPDALGITASVPKVGEIWLYVPFGAKRLTIKHPRLSMLRDYMYPMPIEKSCVYELVLTTGRVVVIPTEQWLVITTDPKNAMVYVDDIYEAGTDGTVQKYVKCGKYNYRITAPLYHTEAGVVEVTAEKRAELPVKLKPAFGYLTVNTTPESGARVRINGEDKGVTPYKSDRLKEGEYTLELEKNLFHPVQMQVALGSGLTKIQNVEMKPAFGYVQISSSPESGAQVLLDGEDVGATPYKSDRLKSGEHRIQVVKAMFQPVERIVNVIDGKTEMMNVDLSATFASVTFNTDLSSDIWVDGKRQGTGRWAGRLNAGVHAIEVRKDKHRTVKQSIEVQVGESKIVELPAPAPIYGALNISTTPAGVTIILNGKGRGTTPQMLKNVLIGSYELKLSKEGCATDIRTVTVEEGKTLPINVTLSQGKSIRLKTLPEGGMLWVDGKSVGQSPQQVELGYGMHSVKGEIDYKIAERELEVKAEGGVSEFVLKFGFSCGETLTDDRDGQRYPTVQVGGQCWMAKNLNYALNRICYEDKVANCNTYGGLYTWENAKNACPSGWHLPSDGEWTTLDKVPSGWNAQLGGFRSYTGYGFYYLGSYGYWWSSTPNSTLSAWGRTLDSTGVGASFSRGYYGRSNGFSVRCLRNIL